MDIPFPLSPLATAQHVVAAHPSLSEEFNLYWRASLTALLAHAVVLHRATVGPVRSSKEFLAMLSNKAVLEEMLRRVHISFTTSAEVREAKTFFSDEFLRLHPKTNDILLGCLDNLP